MATTLRTPKLDLLRVQEEWQFGDKAFNRVIDDMDDKLVGINHLKGSPHWVEWESGTTYSKNDVVRYKNLKSHQFAVCVEGGVSGEDEPINNVTGSIFSEGDVRWKISSLTEATSDGGDIQIWLGGGNYYTRGQAVLYREALYRCKVDHFSSLTFEDDENKWQRVMASIRIWKPSTYYYEDDTVIYDNMLYRCVTAHTSETTFNQTEEENWEKVSGSGNGIQEWVANTDYDEESIVAIDGVLYKSKIDQTSTTDFSNDINNWEIIMVSPNRWKQETFYPKSSIAIYNNKLYEAATTHESSMTFTSDIVKWNKIGGGDIEEYTSSHYYSVGENVIYNDCIYRCNTAHTSSNVFDATKWDLLYSNIKLWGGNTIYNVGSTVIYDKSIYRCITQHISTTAFDDTKWEQIGGGGYVNEWATSTKYRIGQLVKYNNVLYRCNTEHTSSSFSADVSKWDKLFSSIQEWKANVYYIAGEEVLYNDVIYKCKTAHTSSSFSDDSNKWDLIYSNIRLYSNNTFYKVGSCVISKNKLYRCTTEHTSTTNDIENITKYEEEDWFNMYVDENQSDYPYSPLPVEYVADLGAIYDVTKIQFIIRSMYEGEEDNSRATHIDFYGSDDNVTYNKITELDGIDSKGEKTVDLYYSCRYVKIVTTAVELEYPLGTVCDDLVISIRNPYWQLIDDSTSCAKEWQPHEIYEANEIVRVDYQFYVCKSVHLSADTFIKDYPNWTKMFSNIENWQSQREYKLGQYVNYYNRFYRCNTAHTSAHSFLTDVAKWDCMAANIKIWELGLPCKIDDIVIRNDRIYRCLANHNDTTWTSSHWIEVSPSEAVRIEEWEAGVDYTIGEIVSVDNSLYRAVTTHTSDNTFEDDSSDWEFLYTTLRLWETSTYYPAGTVVISGRNMYISNTNHTSGSTFDADIDKWRLLGSKGIKDIETSKLYLEDDCVLIGGILYRCNTQHTTTSTIDMSKWDIIYAGIAPWVSSVTYKVGDIVTYQGNLYRCITQHTSSSSDFASVSVNFERIGGNKIANYDANTFYRADDLMIYNDSLYKCLASTQNSATPDSTKWALLYSNIKLWQASTVYHVGATVIYDNEIYRCNTTHTSDSSFATDSAKWQKIGATWYVTLWVSNVEYKANTLVYYNNSLYRCNTSHTSNTFSGDIDKWDSISSNIRSWATGIYYKVGDIVLYDDVLYKCITAHSSSAFNTDSANWTSVFSNIRLYANNTFYKEGSCVIYNNKLYRCTADHTSNSDDIEYYLYFSKDSPAFMSLDRTGYYLNNFGKTLTLKRISFTQSSATSSHCETVNIYGSADGTTFTLVTSLTGITSIGTSVLDFYTSCKSIRIEGTDVNLVSGQPVAFYNLKIYTDNPYFSLIGDSTVYIENWESEKIYKADSAVIYNNCLYVCNTTHRSALTFSEDKEFWSTSMPNIPEWGGGIKYEVNQYITYNNKLYKCNTQHTSTTFLADISNWDIISANLTNWVAGRTYKADDVVIYNDRIYRCLQDNDNSSWIETNYWREVSPVDDVKIEEWQTNKSYLVGSYVEKDNQIYKCNTTHTSSSWATDIGNWELISGLRTWTANTLYSAGSLLFYKNKLYKVTTTFTSGTTFDKTNLEKVNSDLQEWQPSYDYLIDDVILYEGQIYIVRFDLTSDTTFDTYDLLENKEVNLWERYKEYEEDDIISYNNTLYIATSDFVSTSSFDSTNLSVITPVTWAANTQYSVGDIVENDGELYLTKVAFTSGDNFAASKIEKLVPNSLTNSQISDIIKAYNQEYSTAVIFKVQDNNGAHNALYYEEDLTNYFTSGLMSEAIADGSFRGIFPGGYIVKSIVVDGTTYSGRWFVADLNYFLHSGDTELTTNHVVLLPEHALGNSQMNTSNTISGGYNNTYMWKTTIPKYATAILNSFGSSHVIQNYRALISTGNSNGASGAGAGWTGTTNNWAWTTIPVANIPTEPMVYGGRVASSSIYDVGVECSQLSLLRHRKDLICTRQMWYWLRAAATSTVFALATNNGYAGYHSASASGGVRPFFLLR